MSILKKLEGIILDIQRALGEKENKDDVCESISTTAKQISIPKEAKEYPICICCLNTMVSMGVKQGTSAYGDRVDFILFFCTKCGYHLNMVSRMHVDYKKGLLPKETKRIFDSYWVSPTKVDDNLRLNSLRKELEKTESNNKKYPPPRTLLS